jgi:hypothetical protein
MSTVELVLPRTGEVVAPWIEWQKGKNPEWWRNYNGVKHERDKFFKEANLGNTVNALGGLMALAGYLYAEALHDSRLSSPSKLLKFNRKYYTGCSMGEDYKAGYRLPGIPRKTFPDGMKGV